MSTEVQKLPKSFSLNPASLNEALKFAELMASSDLVPKAYQGKPGNVLVAVQMGAELNLPAMQAIQNIAVINGKPGIFGDLGKALLLAAGCDIDEDDIAIIEQNQRARCKITRPGRTPVERTYSVKNAQEAKLWGKEGHWSTNKWRQMAWRAFWFAARDAAADILKGLGGAEELMDIPVKEMGEADVVGKAALGAGGTQQQDGGKQAEPEKKPEKPPYPDDKFKEMLPKWKELVLKGDKDGKKKEPSGILINVQTKYTLTNEQHDKITNIATLNLAGEKLAGMSQSEFDAKVKPVIDGEAQ
jgi:hypothetical protein